MAVASYDARRCCCASCVWDMCKRHGAAKLARAFASASCRSSARARRAEGKKFQGQEVAQRALEEARANQLENDCGGFQNIFGMREADLSSEEVRRLVTKKFTLEAPNELELPSFDWVHTDAASVRGYWFKA